MEAQRALRTIQGVLHQVDEDLSFVSDSLRDEFARLYPARDRASSSSAHLNPLLLLQKLRTLQRTLPTLREALLRIHHKKTALITLMRHNLATLHSNAYTVLPIAAPNLSSAASDPEPPTPARTALNQQLTDALVESERQLQHYLSTFLRVHARLTLIFPEAFPKLATDDLDFALLRAAVDVPDAQRALMPVDQNTLVPQNSTNPHVTGLAGGDQHSTKSATGPETKVVKPLQKDPKMKAKPPIKPNQAPPIDVDSASGFCPVEKAVYNRLPRNLKIKAGKLAEINTFYEKVWRLLVEAGGTLPENQVLKAVGDTDAKRLHVLRGLAVVRNGKTGWSLP